MLVAQGYVLLALRSDGAPARGDGFARPAPIGVPAALVAELSQTGFVTLDGGRIGLPGGDPGHPLLQRTLTELAPYEGRKLKRRLSALRRVGWDDVVDDMVDTGLLGQVKASTLAFARHVPTDRAGHAALQDQVRSAALGSGPVDPWTATLLSMLATCQMVSVVANDRSERKRAKARIAAVVDQVPRPEAMRAVLAAAAAAIAVEADATTVV